MATYDSLTPEEKAVLHEGEILLRGWWASVVASALDQKIEFLLATWKPIKDTLDNAEVVPNTSGLGGSSDLTALDLQVLFADMKAVNDDIKVAAKFARIVRAIGVNADANPLV